jgi:hypothetical protein
LKIESAAIADGPYASRIIDPAPKHITEALYEMLGDDLELVPVQLVGINFPHDPH